MSNRTETLEGYVVDMGCIRKYPQDEQLARARAHTTECATMGHCVESGYGLVDEQGRVAALDPKATPRVVNALREASSDHGVWLRAKRVMKDEEMETTDVAVVPGAGDGS